MLSASLAQPPSSRGLGPFLFTEVTGIRIPLGVFSVELSITTNVTHKKISHTVNIYSAPPKSRPLAAVVFAVGEPKYSAFAFSMRPRKL